MLLIKYEGKKKIEDCKIFVDTLKFKLLWISKVVIWWITHKKYDFFVDDGNIGMKINYCDLHINSKLSKLCVLIKVLVFKYFTCIQVLL